jgi:transcriptional regulator of met regulon
MLLEKSNQFQTEFRQFKESIEKVTDTKTKQQLENLLNQMLNEVKELDKCHLELIYQQQLPTSVDNHRSKLFEIRKQINRLLKDWKFSKKSRSKQSS